MSMRAALVRRLHRCGRGDGASEARKRRAARASGAAHRKRCQINFIVRTACAR
jgi:hypothetical protein